MVQKGGLMPIQTDAIVTHTPGPWSITAQDTRALYVEAESDSFIAEVFASDQAAANARLIAAAPELLVIAQAVYQPFLEGNLYGDHDYATELLGRLRKAIAKAEGRES